MSDLNRRTLVRSAAAGTAVAAFWREAAAATDGNLYVIAELVAKPDQADALRKLMVSFTEGARKELGCKHYVLLEDKEQAGRFLTFETWTDAAALAAHMKTPAIQAVSPRLGPMLVKPFTQIKLTMISE